MSQTAKKSQVVEHDDNERSRELQDSPMMAHLLEALQKGTDIGHYGRLTFAMVARHFLDEDEIVKLLSKQPDHNDQEARALLHQVKAHNDNPPKRERILEWQSQQDFAICPNPEDPNSCNLYRELQFPDDVYEHIEEYYEHNTDSNHK